MDNLVPPVLEPSYQSDSGTVFRADCASKTRVVIEHRDTLGRPLPAGIAVELIDCRHRRCPGVTDADGISQHPDVVAGPCAWQLRDAPGRHLVAIGDTPLHPVAAGLVAPEAIAAVPETILTATYLPPPILVNLRTPPESAAADLLSEAQLEQLRLDGGCATLFVHGYNVALGDWARFSPAADAAGSNPPPWRGTPLLEPDGAATVSTLCQSQAGDADARGLNGSGAHGWLANLEYQLNRAAGMPEDDWRRYSRVVAIAWPGDTGATEFIEAELRATQSGRRLANVLRQLLDAGLTLNLVSHSLGARVALTALNLLGQRGDGRHLDTLFLWQPAVADNALSPDTPFTDVPPRDTLVPPDPHRPGREVHPLGMGTFPAAYRAVKNIVVLHSHEDGILGPPDETVQWYDPRDWLDAVAALADAPGDDHLGKLGGAYTKKWWTFPPMAADGLRYFQDYYFERGRALGGAWEPALLVHLQQQARDNPTLQRRIERAWDALTEAIVDEARRVAASLPDGPLRPDTPLPAYDLLAPLAHHYRISERMARLFAEQLRLLGRRDGWQPRDTEARPALGLVGFESLIKDPFFEPRLNADVFDDIDQSLWLFEHSGMKYPSEETFINSYQDGIVERIKRNSRFGRY